jgi:putative membrane-bound dehydrogenase-like protein
MRPWWATGIVVVVALLFRSDGALAQGYAPEEAAKRMTVADGLEVRLFASEPMVRQPVAIEFDDRGRAWVIQYLQYPNPAGLERVKVDRYSRTVYDRMPEPPPRGPKGNDRITILEDRDGDGRADHSHDFVQGLNLASGLAFGHRGVFVLQAPYLLFYADRDRDDRPDGEPEVLVTGFGIDDAHSVANSLTWGPDGWLYGVQGSTVTAKIGGIEFQQGVWRYHPRTKRFELYCEGGGNMWGLDFDRHGQLFASTNVGGFVMLHGMPGGYYWKSFGKHGPLHNPYTFGYFDHVRHEGLKGGHVAVGGLFYEAEGFGAEWRGQYIAGDLLDHSVHVHEVWREGSTYRARQVGDVLRANDPWFAPTDVTLGSDGALYVTDWHDKRTAHPDPDADWDRSNGRVFVISGRGAKRAEPVDLTRRSNDGLVDLLDHPNVWYRRRARRMLAERGATDVLGRLRARVLESSGSGALEALWALHGCGGLDRETVLKLVGHEDPDVRAWCVRLVVDEPPVMPGFVDRLIAMARTETDARVRAELACAGQRVNGAAGVELVYRLLLHETGADADAQLPLLSWWAVERHAVAEAGRTVALFGSAEGWQSSLIRSAILTRLVRRYASDRSRERDVSCARLIASAPSGEARQPLLMALEEAWRGRVSVEAAPGISKMISDLATGAPENGVLTRVAGRLGDGAAITRARGVAAMAGAPVAERVAMIELLGEIHDRSSMEVLLDLATREGSVAGDVRLAALSALGRYDDTLIATGLLATYPRQDARWRSRARDLLLSRAGWAKAYLAEIDGGTLPASDVTLEQLGRFATTLQTPELAAIMRKHWGTTKGATREERLAEVRRLNNDLRAGPGDASRGRQLFQQRCASCHRLNGEGETIGPDLTFANRKDRDYLLVSLVDPSGAIRKEYQAFRVAMRDGRVASGLIVEQSAESVTLRDAKGERTRMNRSEIEEIHESDVSIMPESLYKEFSPEQLRDLFGFLEGTTVGGGK